MFISILKVKNGEHIQRKNKNRLKSTSVIMKQKKRPWKPLKNIMNGDVQLNKLIAGFTQDGTPLSATIGSKMEHGVVILTAAMLANTNLAASMDPEEMVDSAIHYYNIIQKRLGYYQEHQAHSLERLLGN